MRVSGDVDLSCAGTVESACAECLEDPGTTALVVDLSDTGFLDSSGIAMLVRVHQRADSAGIPVTIAASTRRVVRSLEISGAAATLVVASSPSAACAAARDAAGIKARGDTAAN